MDIMDVVTSHMAMQAAKINQSAAISVLKMSMDMQQETADQLLTMLAEMSAVTGKGANIDIQA